MISFYYLMRNKCVKRIYFRKFWKKKKGIKERIKKMSECFDQLIILNNFEIQSKKDTDFECKKWHEELRRIPNYLAFDTKYSENKTIIYGYRTNNVFLFPMDCYMNVSTVIISKNMNRFVDLAFEKLVLYQLNKMRNSTYDWTVMNEISYKMNIYLPIDHEENIKLVGSNYLKRYDEKVRKTVLGRNLIDDYYRYEFVFRVNQNWEIVLPMENANQNNVSGVSGVSDVSGVSGVCVSIMND